MQERNTPLVSVIIPTLRGAGTLPAVVSRLLASDYTCREVVLIDNGADKETRSVIESLPVEVNVVHSDRNLGFAGGVNLGITHSRGEIVAMLNDDAEVYPDWLGKMVRILQEDSGIGLAGSLILEADGRTIQHTGSYFEWACLNQHFDKGKPLSEIDYTRPIERDYIMGAALAIRRETLQVLGGLAECYFPGYYEDSELCCQIRKLGLRIVVLPDARVVHREKQSLPNESSYLRIYHRNRWLFIMRNMPWLRIPALKIAELRWLLRVARYRDFKHHRAAFPAYLNCLVQFPRILAGRWRMRSRLRKARKRLGIHATTSLHDE